MTSPMNTPVNWTRLGTSQVRLVGLWVGLELLATTREDSEVALVHDPKAEPLIADQPPPHGHGLEADWCSWVETGSNHTVNTGLWCA